jgi:hypothetical protein
MLLDQIYLNEPLSKKETLTTKNSEVLDVGLASDEYFIWSLVQAFTEVESV